MSNNIITQGKFTQPAAAKTVYLALASDVDWLKVYNWSNIKVPANKGLEFYWQRGMADGAGIEYKGTGGTNTSTITALTTTGFTLIDTSDLTPGKLNGPDEDANITAISNAAIPVVTNDNDNHLRAGDIVRIFEAATGSEYGSIDIEVGHNTLNATDFDLTYLPQQAIAATTASWRRLKYDPIYYPTYRYITKMTLGATTLVTFSVTHGYKVGQTVRFDMGSYADSTLAASTKCNQINGEVGTITAVSTANNTITVDLDTSSGYDAFIFPTHAIADNGYTPAKVVPIGMDIRQALVSGVDLYSDATVNNAYIGIRMEIGDDCPGGNNENVMYWVAGKSETVDNTGSLVK